MLVQTLVMEGIMGKKVPLVFYRFQLYMSGESLWMGFHKHKRRG